MKNGTRTARWAAAAVALGLAGCAEFNELTGGYPEPGSDEAVAAAAQTRLRSDPMLGRETFSVEVTHGVATVRGSVERNAERVRALQIVEDVDGVVEVKDRIRRR